MFTHCFTIITLTFPSFGQYPYSTLPGVIKLAQTPVHTSSMRRAPPTVKSRHVKLLSKRDNFTNSACSIPRAIQLLTLVARFRSVRMPKQANTTCQEQKLQEAQNATSRNAKPAILAARMGNDPSARQRSTSKITSASPARLATFATAPRP